EKRINLLLENDAEEKIEKEAEKKRAKKIKIMNFIFILFLQPFLQPFLITYNAWAQATTTKIIKTIKNDIKSSYEQDIYSKVRIVKKDELKIKQSNRRDSSTIGELNFGDVVEMVYKKKNWTKIRKIENDAIMEGWVYTRYLQKIN